MKISMKRLFALFICSILVFSMIGCGGKKEEAESSEATIEEETAEATETSTEESDEKSVAVVYFSATGTTKEIAEMIAKEARK